MSYVLFLGFKSSIYKKAPTIRISLDDFFLDEFVVESIKNDSNHEDINNYQLYSNDFIKIIKKQEKTNPIPPHKFYPKNLKNFFPNYENFRIFELDKKIIESKDDHKLLIEIFNNDSNYTNGFMNKSTLVALTNIHVIPKDILSNLDRFFDLCNLAIKEWRATHFTEDFIKNSYKIKPNVFNLIHYNAIKTGNSWTLPWYRKSNNKKEDTIPYAWIGGNGHYEFFFPNQLVMYDKNTIKNFAVDHPNTIYGLSNKYKEYEDYRNTD